MGVVADVCDPMRCEIVLEHRQHFFAHEVRYPRIDTMCNDVVELAEVAGDVHDIEVQQLDVGQLQRDDGLQALIDRPTAEVDPHECAVRKLEGHGDEIVADTASEFEHAAVWNRGRVHPVQRRQGGETIRMRIVVRVTRIEDFVVSGCGFSHSRHPSCGPSLAGILFRASGAAPKPLLEAQRRPSGQGCFREQRAHRLQGPFGSHRRLGTHRPSDRRL